MAGKKKFYGRVICVKLNGLTHVQLQALAKFRNKTMSQIVRDALRAEMAKEWGPEQDIRVPFPKEKSCIEHA